MKPQIHEIKSFGCELDVVNKHIMIPDSKAAVCGVFAILFGEILSKCALQRIFEELARGVVAPCADPGPSFQFFDRVVGVPQEQALGVICEIAYTNARNH